jgi:hypothetical protein
MIKKTKQLFAIYKNGEHKGNQRGIDKNDAIKQYVVEAQFQMFLNDVDFMKQYSAIIAIETVHFFKSKYVNL